MLIAFVRITTKELVMNHHRSRSGGVGARLRHVAIRLQVHMRAVLALTLLTVLILGTAAPAAAQAAAPDFTLGVPIRGDGVTPYTGYVVRGGLQSCTGACTGGLSEPKVFVATGIPAAYTWINTAFEIDAVNGFRGTVSLELLNLPPGVTSQTAPSVTLTDTTLICDS